MDYFLLILIIFELCVQIYINVSKCLIKISVSRFSQRILKAADLTRFYIKAKKTRNSNPEALVRYYYCHRKRILIFCKNTNGKSDGEVIWHMQLSF